MLTGQLGDVMKESARIALSYVRSHAEELGIDEEAFDDRSFHVHVPAGAIPKDGPSAGITMTTAIASLLSGRPVKHTVGMTGEVTLQGRVLPIGGLKQKVLAAHAAGLTDVIIPERNRADLDDVPADVKAEMSFHPVMTLDEVLALALEPVACSACAAVAARRSPRRSAARRTSSSGAGRSRSSGRRTRAPSRFNEFSQSLGAIPPATLATRLVELEQAGILARATVEGRPPRTEYRLTGRGLELRGLVAALRRLASA